MASPNHTPAPEQIETLLDLVPLMKDKATGADAFQTWIEELKANKKQSH